MKKLLLAGGGLAHLQVMKLLKNNPIPDTEVTLISPSEFQYYSGMFPGYIEEIYNEKQITINLTQQAEAAGVKWLKGAVTAIDPRQKMVLTDKGEILPYDLVSFNIGSLTSDTDVVFEEKDALWLKPNYRFIEAVSEVEDAEKVVINGSGEEAVEFCLSLNAWRKSRGTETPITLVSPGRLLPDNEESVSEKVEKVVVKKGVHLLTNTGVTSVKNNVIHTSSNLDIPFEKLVWITEPRGHELFKIAGLPVDEKGFLLVEDTLQVKKFPAIFAAGDCMSLAKYPKTVKNKTYALEEGRILFENLKGYLGSGEGERVKPPRGERSILSSGNREGILLFKKRTFMGRWVWHLKNRIDLKILHRYQ
ncbi:NAD(P)/FAD-dependent oxidoreductase [Bacillus marinisedimentorum]|uniref:NAD(P)/FAD-dependent oxidoreductase n=1 Tax=Bacillus marinisedimentorum TaxID=1821260 RepID=UPI0009F46938|nr:FAD-dependent oxidoreductase [Bacillus marinisedimentorum]